jgi:hypothetical protein
MSGLKKRLLFYPIFLVCLLLAYGFHAWHKQGRNPHAISATGGEPFQNLPAVETPFYLQTDSRWQHDKIGGSGETLGNVGCTLCGLAMALDHYGFRKTPAELNRLLIIQDGYTGAGLIKWDSVAVLTEGKIIVDYSSPLAFASIDNALKLHQPVLVRIFISNASPHWVLIVGKEGLEYLVRDPLGDGQSLDRLSNYGSDIHSLRIVKPKP